jgi:nucleotide-binding universal stress UspA family protein
MSQSTSTKPVTVGIDGTPAGQRGVRYAALEARRLGVPLSIVHVTPGYSRGRGVPVVPVVSADKLHSYGTELLELARKNAQATVSDLEVHTSLTQGGTTVHCLAHGSEDASMLVLGAERRSFAGRVWTGDVVAGVASRAACPVVVVPPEWEPDHVHGRVVVGIKDAGRAAELVATGMEQAHRLGTELVIIHAWKLASGYDDIVANRVSSEEYGGQQTALIEPLVHARRAEHPHVDVRIEVLHAQPADALVRASADADLLLISRPQRGGRVHHLGGTGRAVLQEARCPVEVHPDEQRD